MFKQSQSLIVCISIVHLCRSWKEKFRGFASHWIRLFIFFFNVWYFRLPKYGMLYQVKNLTKMGDGTREKTHKLRFGLVLEFSQSVISFSGLFYVTTRDTLLPYWKLSWNTHYNLKILYDYFWNRVHSS